MRNQSLRNSPGSVASAAYNVLTRTIAASQLVPRVTSGPSSMSSETATHLNNYDSTDFDGSTAEYGDVLIDLPSGGTFTAEFLWTCDNSPGSLVFSASARAMTDGDSMDSATGTAQQVADTILSAGGYHQSAPTPAITVAGSPAAGKLAFVRIGRAPADAADTATLIDGRLLGVLLRFQP